MFRPSSESVTAVREWLVVEGIAPSRIKLSKSGGWLEADVTVAEAERLLKTEYLVFTHAPTDTQHVGCGSGYHIPDHLSQHVDLILPTVQFDVRLSANATKTKRFGVTPGQSRMHKSIMQKPAGAIEVCRSHYLQCILIELRG